MKIKASELKAMLAGVANADAIIAEQIQKGEIIDDLGGGAPMFKSEAFETLAKALQAAVEKLNALPTELEKPATNERAERLAKSKAAENAPEVVEALNELGKNMDAAVSSLFKSQSELAKGLAAVAEADSQSIRGYVDLATRVQSLSTQMGELMKSMAAPVEPVGVATSAGVPVASPSDNAQAILTQGATDLALFKGQLEQAQALIISSINRLEPLQQSGPHGAAMQNDIMLLQTGGKSPAEILAAYK